MVGCQKGFDMTRVGVGIDIGGSGVKGALVDLDKGEFIGERVRYDTPESSTPLAVAKICKTIIESHGGQIWAENRPEGGAVFRLSLPLPPVPEISDEGLK